MTHYAWTLRARGRQDIQRVTTLAELQETLRTVGLPGVAPTDWIVANIWRDTIPAHGQYTHDEGGKHEWSLIWTKVDW
ncbi:hypothetical protein JNB71_14530 [Rhizobium herbae]|uniref:Uncharacterized protein n=1 Tax=Rhizobium herbae TaxID=508661 RepID=A0ABS7HB91_9HYPH|nr:hypothetical protein [Rhizobium herbae]MBW9064539.1 hypothetical protein [Rhizobium herbae]